MGSRNGKSAPPYGWLTRPRWERGRGRGAMDSATSYLTVIAALAGSTQRLSKSPSERQDEPVAQDSRSLGKIAATMPCAPTGVTAPEVRSTTLGVPSEL